MATALLAQTKPVIVTPENKQDGILSWDFDNNYPERRRNVIGGSVTGMACLREYARYVNGQGATDKDFYKAIVNSKGLKGDAFIRRICWDKAFVDGVAVHVNYNALFDKVEATPVRIDDVRITIDRTKAAVHPNWAKRKDKKRFVKKEVQLIDWYDPRPEVIQAQVDAAGGWDKYKGQIFYWTPLGLTYPIAVWDASAIDMESEANMGTFRNRTSGQNFLASHIVIVDGDDEAETEDEADLEGVGRESGSHYAQAVQSMLSDFQSPENAASMMVVKKPDADSTFDVQKLELQNYDGLYEKTEASSKDSIIESFMIPKALLLRSSSSLGTSNEIENAKAFYNDITSDDRLVIEEILTEIFSNWETEICPSGDFSITPIAVQKIIPIDYKEFFTTNEMRASLDQPPAEDTEADTRTLAEKIGVGGVTAITAVIASKDLSPEQKKGTLTVVFGLDETEVDAMIGGTTPAPAVTETQTEP